MIALSANRKNRVAAIAVATSLVAIQVCAAANPAPEVVPAVQHWTGGEGELVLKGGALVVDDKQSAALDATARVFQSELRSLGIDLPIREAAAAEAGSVFLTLVPSLGSREIGERLAKEGYRLEISDRVVIAATTPTGVFYGMQTLAQMLAGRKTPSLPRGTIVDYPRYQRRMLMLDVGRKLFPIAVLKDYLRILAWYKMNELHLHLSDEAFGGKYTGFRVECATYPGLTSRDGSYTKKQLHELQDLAADLCVTITPEIDMPGHARVFTDYWPELTLKGYPNYLDVTNPRTIERMKRLLDEMIPIFDAPDFHIGTDEYRVGGPRQEELHEAFRRFINTMNAHIRSRGKNCRIWSGFEHMKGKTQIDPAVIIDMWETDDANGQIAKGHSIINSNHGRTYIVPGAHYYGVSNVGIYNGWEPWMVSGDMAKNPSKDNPRLLGGKLHVWNDQGPTGYTMNEIARLALPSIQVFAEKLWGTKGSKDYAEFQLRAERVSVAPGVKLLSRVMWPKHDGFIMKIPAEMDFPSRDFEVTWETALDVLDPSAKEPAYVPNEARSNLEYPWTLTVEIFKPAESETRGVIFSSRLAEICTDYARTENVTVKGPDGKDVKKAVTRRGIGVIRAAGSPGKDPASAHLAGDVSRIYSDPLPLNRWVALTIVGQQRSTIVYLNGQKVGASGEQMLCPLLYLGSVNGQSFVGKIRNLKIWDRALSAKEVAREAGIDVPDNLAAHCRVTASASDTPYGFTPEKIVDENSGTRWSSGITSAEQWVEIDLGRPVEFNTVKIAWEHARPKKLRIQVSDDRQTWKDIEKLDVAGEQTAVSFTATTARYVRLLMSQPATQWGYSIWEVEVQRCKKTP